MREQSYVSQLFEHTKRHRLLMLAIICSSIGTTLIFLALPLFVQTILDDHILVLTRHPWYETTTSNAVVSGKQVTQDTSLAHDVAEPWFVVYVEGEPFLVSHVEANQAIQLEGTAVVGVHGVIADATAIPIKDAELTSMYEKQYQALQRVVLTLALLVAIHPLLAWVNNWSVRKFSREVIADFRMQGFEKLEKLPIDYFNQRQDGKFISYLISDVSMFFSLASNIGIQLLQAGVMFLGIYGLLLWLDWRLFLVAVAFLPLLYLWIRWFRNKVSVYYEQARAASSSLNAMLNEQFKGISIIRSFGYEGRAQEEFDVLNEAVYENNRKSLKQRALFTGSVVNVIRRAMWIAILVYAGFSYFHLPAIGLTVGTIYLLITYVNYYVEPLYQIFSVLTTIEQANVSIQRYFKYMREAEETERVGVRVAPIPRLSGSVRFQGVSFAYGTGNAILKNISLNIAANQTVAIVGHTGSGKSSLMNLLLRFYDYQEGEGAIYVDDWEIQELSRDVYREHIGIILQDPVLFKGSLYDVITWGDDRFTAQEVEEALYRVGAADLLSHPDGVYQQVLEMGSNFSLGQRQLIAFARAIIQNPAILVLDEATANVDTETERKIQDALAVAAADRTTFIIAHRLSTVKHADVIVVLSKGEIVEQGSHNELLAHQGAYYEMYTAQAQNTE